MKIKNFTLVCQRLPENIAAITLFPFIIYKKESYTQDHVLVNHERIHLQQQLELLLFPFYIWYGIEFLLRFIYYKNAKKAYREISFEREAYRHDTDLTYLKTRKFYSFWKYLKG